MWKEKVLLAMQRLPKDFGRAVQAFIYHGESQERETAEKYMWVAGTRVKEVSPQSEWMITLSGTATTATPLNAALFGKPAQYTREYRAMITAYLQVDDTVKLVLQADEEHWSKLAGLWDRLWADLARQGYIEAPAPTVSAPAPRQKLAERDADDMDVQARKKLLRGYLERVLIKAQSQRLAAELAGGNRSSLERWRKEFPEVEEEVRAAIKKRK